MTPPNCATCVLAPAKPWDIYSEADAPDIAIVYSVPLTPSLQQEDGVFPLGGDYGYPFYLMLKRSGLLSRSALIPIAACSVETLEPLERFEAKVKARLRKLKRDSSDVLPSLCCEPLWQQRLAPYSNVICLGKEAAEAVLGGSIKIDKIRGSFQRNLSVAWRDTPINVGVTLDPHTLGGRAKWAPTVERDLGKFLRYVDGKELWKAPEIEVADTIPKVLFGLEKLGSLAKSGEPISVDTETNSIHPTDCKVRCVQFGTPSYSIVIPFWEKDDEFYVWSGEDDDIVRTAIRFFRNDLADSGIKLLGQNADVYDHLVFRSFFGWELDIDYDCSAMHVLADNEMPHGLGYMGSDALYTDMPEAWKAEHTATEAETDEELYDYGGKDTSVTAEVARPIYQHMVRSKQQHLLPWEVGLRAMGREMQQLGMRVDLARVQHYRVDAEKLERDSLGELQQIAPGLNPASHQQVASLLFEKWELPIIAVSDITGEPSTDDKSLRRLRMQAIWDREDGAPTITEEQEHALMLIARVRGAKKRQSGLAGLIPRKERYWSGGEWREGLVRDDGRIHPSYGRLAASGRYTSGGKNTFNAQNIDIDMRDMIIPEEGHVFIYADMDQLELRNVAERANVTADIEAINNGLDPHISLMDEVYGEALWALEGAPPNRYMMSDAKKKASGQFIESRDKFKNVRYAIQYGGAVDTVHLQATKAEAVDGRLLYGHVRPREVAAIMRNILKRRPQVKLWWQAVQEFFSRHGYVTTSLWGRRRYCRDGFDLSTAANHEIQGDGAEVCHEGVSAVSMPAFTPPFNATSPTATGKSPGSIPFNFREATGLVNYTHDSGLWEVRACDSVEALAIVAYHLNRRRKQGAKLDYTSKPEVVTCMK